jgi:hypothetical protein
MLAKMAWFRHSRVNSFIAVWVCFVALLPSPADAQAYYGGDINGACNAVGQNHRHLGCFAGDQSYLWVPRNYITTNPFASFPNWQSNGPLNNTVNPVDCTRTCRGHGYKYAAIFKGICSCGVSYPTGILTSPSSCNQPCGSNAEYTCGGTSATDIYADPSFAAPNAIAASLLDSSLITKYKYLGCFFRGSAFQTNNSDSASLLVVNTPESCLAYCAQRNYPLVAMAFGNV